MIFCWSRPQVLSLFCAWSARPLIDIQSTRQMAVPLQTHVSPMMLIPLTLAYHSEVHTERRIRQADYTHIRRIRQSAVNATHGKPEGRSGQNLSLICDSYNWRDREQIRSIELANGGSMTSYTGRYCAPFSRLLELRELEGRTTR